MAIYVKFKKPRTINEFLILFYTRREGSGQAYAAYTYYDKNCHREQCNKIRRSFDDLLELVQTYYPSTTPKILISRLLKLKLNNYKYICLTNCSGMSKIRISYFIYADYASNYNKAVSIDKLKSKYSWKDLLDKIGITNEKQYQDYIKNK